MLHRFQTLARVVIVATLSATVLGGCMNSPGLLIDPPARVQDVPSFDAESARQKFNQSIVYSDDHCRRAGYQSREHYEKLLTERYFAAQKLDPQWIPIASKRQIRVGMPLEVVRFAWGNPSNTGFVRSNYTNTEYWHYQGANYQTTTLSFEGGVLSSIIR